MNYRLEYPSPTDFIIVDELTVHVNVDVSAAQTQDNGIRILHISAGILLKTILMPSLVRPVLLSCHHLLNLSCEMINLVHIKSCFTEPAVGRLK